MVTLFPRECRAQADPEETISVKPGEGDPVERIRAALEKDKRIQFQEPAPEVPAEFLIEELLKEEGRESENLPRIRIGNIRVKGRVDLWRRTISREVALDDVTIDGGFRCVDCRFLHRFALVDKSAVASASQGVPALDLRGSRFEDNLELQGLRVAGEAILAQMEVARTLYLDSAIIEGGVDLRQLRAGALHAHALSVTACGKCRFRGENMSIAADLILEGGKISADFSLENTQVGGTLNLRFTYFSSPNTSLAATKTDGCLNLTDTVFKKGVDLSNLSFGRLATRLRAETDENTWSAMRNLLRQAEFRAEQYTQLEEYFRNRGQPDLADAVYLERRSQERVRQLKGTSAAVNWLLEVLVGYGRRPYLALIWSLFFVALGMRVFAREVMVCDKTYEGQELKYNAFWYSLDVFLPLTHLRAADVWVPRPRSTWRWTYLRIHHLLGWILIPLGLAAVSGLVN
jgi:hypothetical protein